MSKLKSRIKKKLKEIDDPELKISLFDLGLIYEIQVDEKKKDVKIIMTLTSIGCPLFDVIENSIKNGLSDLKLKKLEVVLTFDPPWNIDKMTKKGRAYLGL
jgi:metal-sulfur cluster biosynthetic enzyme